MQERKDSTKFKVKIATILWRIVLYISYLFYLSTRKKTFFLFLKAIPTIRSLQFLTVCLQETEWQRSGQIMKTADSRHKPRNNSLSATCPIMVAHLSINQYSFRCRHCTIYVCCACCCSRRAVMSRYDKGIQWCQALTFFLAEFKEFSLFFHANWTLVYL